MKNIRIEPLADGHSILLDIECDYCGNNGLKDEVSGKHSFQHQVKVGEPDRVLVCSCGKKYRIHPQRTHVHVFSE